MKAAKTEDGSHSSQSTHTVLDPEKRADFPLLQQSAHPLAAGDLLCVTSICGNKCVVPRLNDAPAFCCLPPLCQVSAALWAYWTAGEEIRESAASCLHASG